MSIVFYSWWNPKFTIILVLSVCFNYLIGNILNNWSFTYFSKKVVLFFGVFVNLAVLGYYKYFNFFISNVDYFFNTDIQLHNIVLPIGISFFTFTQIAFLVDVYKGYTFKHNFVSYFLFVTFFPQLIAGPILHHKEMVPQFEKNKFYKVSWQNIYIGLSIFILGLAKKTIIADNLASLATPVFDLAAQNIQLDFFFSWIGALAYSLQLYFDFSGYSDMAIGLSLLFNIKSPVNFFSPYKASSIIDFWRRWHMTLSRYLRDYLYIPLGGNRVGEKRYLCNLMITMLLGGLWHGAGWTFIFWGFLHGTFLIINHTWRRYGLSMSKIFSWPLTFCSVVFAWVFFRADSFSSAINVVKGMVGMNGFYIPEKWFEKYMFIKEIFGKYTNYEQVFSLKNSAALIIILIVCIRILPNVIELMAKYKPALNIDERSVETKILKYTNFTNFYINDFILALIAVSAIISISKASEFLYFQF